MSSSSHGPLRVGIGGPVGSGKTALTEMLCKYFRDTYDLCAITNDIYTKEKSLQFLHCRAISVFKSYMPTFCCNTLVNVF